MKNHHIRYIRYVTFIQFVYYIYNTYPTIKCGTPSFSIPRGFGDATPFSAASNRLGALGRCLNTSTDGEELLQLVPTKEIWTSGRGRWAVSAVLCLKSFWKTGRDKYSAFQICHCIVIASIDVTKLNALRLLHFLHSIYWIEELSALLEFMVAIASIELNALMLFIPFIELNALVAPWCIQVEIFASRCTISMVEA